MYLFVNMWLLCVIVFVLGGRLLLFGVMLMFYVVSVVWLIGCLRLKLVLNVFDVIVLVVSR